METKNLADAQKEKAKVLHAKLTAWREATGAKMPSPHKAGEKPADFKSPRGEGDE